MKMKRKATNTTRKGEKKNKQSEWGKEMCKYVLTHKENTRMGKTIITACKGE
jgi:protein subunit release factor B